MWTSCSSHNGLTNWFVVNRLISVHLAGNYAYQRKCFLDLVLLNTWKYYSYKKKNGTMQPLEKMENCRCSRHSRVHLCFRQTVCNSQLRQRDWTPVWKLKCDKSVWQLPPLKVQITKRERFFSCIFHTALAVNIQWCPCANLCSYT